MDFETFVAKLKNITNKTELKESLLPEFIRMQRLAGL